MLVLGTDVWADHAEEAALQFVEETGIPVISNGMGRGIIPGGHPQLVTKARSTSFNQADLVIVVGTPLDFRLGYGIFGGKEGATPAKTVHIADSPGQVSTHAELAASASGDLTQGVHRALQRADRAGRARPSTRLVAVDRHAAGRGRRGDGRATASCSRPRPTRSTPPASTASCCPGSADDAVVIGDGGDFVSFAGKFVEPKRPGGWLDPGPYGCLGAGMGAAMAARIARPSSQVVLLYGDGAAGMSLMDVDTLVRHNLPVVMVVGNNSAWGLEKGPMQWLYGYDVAADLAPQTRYDQVVTALGGGGEMVTDPKEIGPGARPRVRLRRPLPRQRHDRRQRGLPARHHRHLTWSIRPALEEEYAAVGELTVAGYDADGYLTYPDGTFDDGYAGWLADAASRAGNSTLLVAIDGDELVGTVTWCPYGSADAQLGQGAAPGRVPHALDRARGARARDRPGAGRGLPRSCPGRRPDRGADCSRCSEMVPAHRLYARRIRLRPDRPSPEPRPGPSPLSRGVDPLGVLAHATAHPRVPS